MGEWIDEGVTLVSMRSSIGGHVTEKEFEPVHLRNGDELRLSFDNSDFITLKFKNVKRKTPENNKVKATVMKA